MGCLFARVDRSVCVSLTYHILQATGEVLATGCWSVASGARTSPSHPRV